MEIDVHSPVTEKIKEWRIPFDIKIAMQPGEMLIAAPSRFKSF